MSDTMLINEDKKNDQIFLVVVLNFQQQKMIKGHSYKFILKTKTSLLYDDKKSQNLTTRKRKKRPKLGFVN